MIKTQKVYEQLYTDKEHFIILITGGRGSGKSFNAATFIERLTFDKAKDGPPHCVLYTRYTMSSASISVIPELREKIDMDGTSQYFITRKSEIENTLTGGGILFRGIHTSSGNQTAKLKSIQGVTTFVCDEAEEWTSEEDFDKLVLSIRQKGIQNRIIIIMNPTNTAHFVYRKYIKDTHKIEYFDGVPVQISTHPSVLHIHTTYFDNMEHLGDEFLKEVERIKNENHVKYAHTVIGRWSDVSEGAVFKKYGVVNEFPSECERVAIGLDFGYTNDVSAAVRCGVIGNRLYIDELFYLTGMLSSDLTAALKPYNLPVIADSADPRLIDEILLGGVTIYSVQKYAGSISAGISKMTDMELFITKHSVNVLEEFTKYVWKRNSVGAYTNTPEDHDNHAIDAARYYTLGVLLGKVAARRDVSKDDLGIY